MPRLPLNKLLYRLVDKWSTDYIYRAQLGETEAMVQVAEIMFSKRGWGEISYNPQQGRRWLEIASHRGDPFASYALRNLSTFLRQRHEEAKQLTRYQVGNLEKPKLGFNVEKELAEMTNNTHRGTPFTKEPYLKKNVQRQQEQQSNKQAQY